MSWEENHDHETLAAMNLQDTMNISDEIREGIRKEASDNYTGLDGCYGTAKPTLFTKFLKFLTVPRTEEDYK